ncbi:MAG: HAD-IIA family hydrolase [Anaerolineales bacterium]|nr:HAD-IIA family hydrolase [Anaerolineales bacterium]
MTTLKHLILDMDGVLWRGETPMPGLPDFFDTLRRLDIGFVLATNNATKTAAQYTDKLQRFGVDVPAAQIVTSAEATAAYLRETYAAGTAVYVVGERGLHDALTAQQFAIVTADQVRDGFVPALVVVGFNRHVVYRELAMGALAVHKGARFIGTNPDPSFPSELGPLPGAGALLAVIETGTGVAPTVVGKPGPIMFAQAMRRLGGTPADTAMVGDRLTTDIAGAKAAGLRGILLLSGISRMDDLTDSPIQPDAVYADITELAAQLEESRVYAR